MQLHVLHCVFKELLNLSVLVINPISSPLLGGAQDISRIIEQGVEDVLPPVQ